jgi:hypothetical protein
MAPAAIAQLKAEIARREKDQEPVQVPLLPR